MQGGAPRISPGLKCNLFSASPPRYQLEEHWLGKTKEEFKQLQRDEPKWREMVEYLEGGQIPRSKYPRATLDQFTVEKEILYLVKKNIDNTFKYVRVTRRTNESSL